MQRLFTAIALAASALASAPLLAQDAAGEKVRMVIVYGDDAAPKADADEIIVLNDGRVAERGRHADLLRANGLYAEMWTRQAAERELEEV